jgi:hypothetical protein
LIIRQYPPLYIQHRIIHPHKFLRQHSRATHFALHDCIKLPALEYFCASALLIQLLHNYIYITALDDTFTLMPFQLFEGTGNRHWCLFAALLDKLRLTVPFVACKSSATILVGIYPQLGFLHHIQYCASLHQQSLDQHYTFSNSTIFMYIATIQHATILQIYPYLGPQLCVQYYSFFHYTITLRCCHSACYLVRIDMHWSIQHRSSSTHSALHDCITRLLFHVLP